MTSSTGEALWQVKEITYREGQFLEPEELVLYALMKVTANPLIDPKTRNLTEDRKTLLKWNATVVCKTLGRIFRSHYREEDLYYYLCCMMDLTGEENAAMIGFFDGISRLDYFAPYVDCYLSQCAYPLVRALNGSKTGLLAVVSDARTLCQDVTSGNLAALKPARSLNVKELRFGMLYLEMVKYPSWKFEERADVLMLWKPHVGRPYMMDKAILVYSADMSWEVEVRGQKAKLSWLGDTVDKLTTPKQFNDLIKEVDEAYVCHGIPRARHEAVVTNHFQHGFLYSHDQQSIVARLDGDFIKATDCKLLAPSIGSNGIYPRACSQCGQTLPHIFTKRAESTHTKAQTTKTSFEMETLNTIAKLNVELRDKKQQLVKLWSQYSAMRQEHRKMLDQQETPRADQPQAVCVSEDWVAEQRKVRAEMIRSMHKDGQDRNAMYVVKHYNANSQEVNDRLIQSMVQEAIEPKRKRKLSAKLVESAGPVSAEKLKIKVQVLPTNTPRKQEQAGREEGSGHEQEASETQDVQEVVSGYEGDGTEQYILVDQTGAVVQPVMQGTEGYGQGVMAVEVSEEGEVMMGGGGHVEAAPQVASIVGETEEADVAVVKQS